MTFWKWSATGNWITFTNELMLKVNNWFGPLWFLTFTRVISLSCLQASSPTISTYVCFCHFKAHRETQRMLVGFINDHHFPALFPEGRQPVCHCGLCVTSCLLFFFSCQGAEWKPGREGGSSWRTTASTTLNTQLWVSHQHVFFFLINKRHLCRCVCMLVSSQSRAFHFYFQKSIWNPPWVYSLLVSTRKTARINNSTWLHCCYGYGFQQGALHVNSTNQTTEYVALSSHSLLVVWYKKRPLSQHLVCDHLFLSLSLRVFSLPFSPVKMNKQENTETLWKRCQLPNGLLSGLFMERSDPTKSYTLQFWAEHLPVARYALHCERCAEYTECKYTLGPVLFGH